MRILHACKKYPNAFGGDAVVVSNLEKIQSEKNQVIILTSNCDEINNQENVLKFGLKTSSQDLDKITMKRMLSLMILSLTSFHILKKIKPDVIHSHSSDIGFALSLASRIYRIPQIMTCHGISYPYRQFSNSKRYLEAFCLKYGGFKKIIVVDSSAISALKNNGIVNVVYIPNGIDLKKFSNYKRKRKDNQIIQFLFVGRLEEQKGVKYLIDASALLHKKTGDFRVNIVGDGSLRDKLKTMVEKKSLSDVVRFYGKVSEKKLFEIYRDSDVFVLPSLWEGFPLTILEAWASNLAVITTNVGNIPTFCSNDRDCLLTKPKNLMLAESMRRLIEDGNLRARLKNAGLKNAKKYDWKKINENIVRLYEE